MGCWKKEASYREFVVERDNNNMDIYEQVYKLKIQREEAGKEKRNIPFGWETKMTTAKHYKYKFWQQIPEITLLLETKRE